MDCYGSSRSSSHHIRFTEYSPKRIFDFVHVLATDDPGAFRHTLHDIHERIKLFVLVKTKHLEDL
ncbi:MAG: ArsR family transcriptional regulator, arsenate/arsenite/antimonite-responsive transcriptional [Pseudomonas sp.]|jgi:hypothetical protein|nr:ArsR family transcriptional regulator, arsenate/arsenite/antimonite-responsive transcriptional [Pseudomonas sp.]